MLNRVELKSLEKEFHAFSSDSSANRTRQSQILDVGGQYPSGNSQMLVDNFLQKISEVGGQ